MTSRPRPQVNHCNSPFKTTAPPTRSSHQHSTTTVNRDKITDFNHLRESLAHKLPLDNWFHLTSPQSLHIFSVATKANGNLSIRNTIHINTELILKVYGVNDDITFKVKLYDWRQLQSVIEQFGRKVKRECNATSETSQRDDVKEEDGGSDRTDEAVAFEFSAGNDVESDVEEISIVKTEQPATNDHLRSQRSYDCPECGQTFGQYTRLLLHQRVHEKYFCSECNDTYVGTADHHMSQHHSDASKSKIAKSSHSFGTETRSYECHICHRMYSKLQGLKRHMQSKHVAKSTNPPTKVVNRPRVKCPICDKEFTSKDSLKSHKYRSHEKRNWKECLVCNRSYDNLKRHMQYVHSDESETKNHVCHICGAAYKQMSGLTKHMETKHSEVGEFFCHICCNGKNYRSKWYLKKHFAIVHAYVEQSGREYSDAFGCDSCNERFPSSNTLRQHIRMKHNGVEETEMRLQYEIRDKKSEYKRSPVNHMTEKHAGKTYVCPECGQPFSLPSQLRAHLNQHKGLKDYKYANKKKVCSVCDKRYVAITDLRVHMMKIHGTILPIKTTPNRETE